MFTEEENEALTRVGPGTIMGNFMREYWVPALLSVELPHPDCDPVRIKLLGEDLIAFRDTSGKVGLLANLCPHRKASLFYGRNEQEGLRCIYHGWKFDTTGQCVDMPNERPESNFKTRVRTTAYPCIEKGDLIFTYMGPREVPPPMPLIEELEVPEGSYTEAVMTPANWLQVLEGNIDTSHATILHSGATEPEWYPEGSFGYYANKHRDATFVAVDTESGALYGAYRPGPEGYNYWRLGKFNFPFWTSEAAGYLGQPKRDNCWVPMDDTHTLAFTIYPASNNRGSKNNRRPGILPTNSTDWFGRFVPEYNTENDFLIDREEARELGSFSGMPNDAQNEDNAVQTSMGVILDRSSEMLGTTDLMIIRVRQRLLQAAKAFAEDKAPPPALESPELYGARTGGVMIPIDADWLEYTEELRKPFIDNGPPDPLLAAEPPFKAKGHRHERPGPMF